MAKRKAVWKEKDTQVLAGLVAKFGPELVRARATLDVGFQKRGKGRPKLDLYDRREQARWAHAVNELSAAYRKQGMPIPVRDAMYQLTDDSSVSYQALHGRLQRARGILRADPSLLDE